MFKITLSIFFTLLSLSSFSSSKIQKEFKSKKDIDKVSFFRSLSNEEKAVDIYFFKSEFNTLLKRYSNTYTSKKLENLKRKD